MSGLYIGLMSGTSLDAADGVLVDFSSAKIRVLASATQTFSNNFRAELMALNSPSHNELQRAALAANQLAEVYATVVNSLLHDASLAAKDIQAIGAHGQTVRHQPVLGYTTQLNNPALLAERTGIDVVADFRSRDVAAGGQGAPLVPAFHQSVFGKQNATTLVLNIGGISNISVLPETGDILGFDCGPGNALMDAWALEHTCQRFDEGGQWAASGQMIPALLASLLDEPYFAMPPPKSTGRDLFSVAWLAEKLTPFVTQRPVDVQNTLTEFTAKACIAGAISYLNNSKDLIVCGGGAFNHYLMQRLQAGFPSLKVASSKAHGLPPLQVEAAAFAWLARQTVLRLPGNLPSVTGAAGLRVLGAIYPA
jgi:anhydro-N-acetylmuramic acid kinase